MGVRTELELQKAVSKDEWLKARKEHLKREKELSRLRDEVNAERLELPMVRIEKSYVFDGPKGKESLGDLFDGRSQLIVYHFMFGPDWEEGCKSCSFLCDHIDGARLHLENHDVSIVVVSRAPLAKLQEFKKRMGWKFKWVSSSASDFNRDFGVSFTKEEMANGSGTYNYKVQKYPSEEAHGTSAFLKDVDGNVFHTYSSFARGLDSMLGAYNWLDISPRGRNESGPMSWLRHKDKY